MELGGDWYAWNCSPPCLAFRLAPDTAEQLNIRANENCERTETWSTKYKVLGCYVHAGVTCVLSKRLFALFGRKRSSSIRATETRHSNYTVQRIKRFNIHRGIFAEFLVPRTIFRAELLWDWSICGSLSFTGEMRYCMEMKNVGKLKWIVNFREGFQNIWTHRYWLFTDIMVHRISKLFEFFDGYLRLFVTIS